MLEFVHNNGIIHRDIKPDNFLSGGPDSYHVIYISDFGLAKRYKDQKTGTHIPFDDRKEITGTVRYASINAHNGIDQTRRDDMESLGYTLLYLLKGKLPWQGFKISDKNEKLEMVKKMKNEISVEKLCKDAPEEFIDYIRHCRGLRYDETPDYTYLLKLINDLFKKTVLDKDPMFDWLEPRNDLPKKQKTMTDKKRRNSVTKDTMPKRPTAYEPKRMLIGFETPANKLKPRKFKSIQ